MELLFNLFFFASSTIWVPVAVFHSLRLSKSISYLKIAPWFSSPLANQKSQRSYSSRRLFFPEEGFPSIYTAVLHTLINGGKRKKYCSQYFLLLFNNYHSIFVSLIPCQYLCSFCFWLFLCLLYVVLEFFSIKTVSQVYILAVKLF